MINNKGSQRKIVIAAVIRKDNKFLLGKRSLHKKQGAGYWSPISGRIEAGESDQDAVVREVFEEIGIKVRPIKKITEFATHDKLCWIHWWLVDIVEGEAYLKNDEHSELRWVTIEEMRNLSPVFEEDIRLFEKLV